MPTSDISADKHFSNGSASWHGLETWIFAVLVAIHLIPVWLFRYVPTQDGPAHVSNAVILRDYGAPATRHHKFFEVGHDPFPNWTSHLVLAGLSWIVPPLVAEKLLVTCYILAFAFGCRYFLASFGGAGLQLAPLALLFVFNRCFFMGFYNYCLSIALIFFILGLCARLPEQRAWPYVLLAALFVLAYFTHLVGYVQAALGTVVLAVFLPGRRWVRLLLVGLALLPSAMFLAEYLTSSGLSISVIAGTVARKLWHGPNAARLTPFWEDLADLNRDLFAPYQAWSIPIESLWLLTFAALAAVGLTSWLAGKPASVGPTAGWWPACTLALMMTVLYMIGPESFGDHGGYLKPRLAIVLPLFFLALLRLPPMAELRYFLLGCAYALVAAQLVCTCSHFAATNRILDRYTAGVDQLDGGHVLYVMQTTNTGIHDVNVLLHASHYYCLEFARTNLDNYEAGGHYFPVRFRAGVTRGRGDPNAFEVYAQRAAVDRILAWEWPVRPGPPPVGFREVYRSGSLAIHERAK